MKRTLVIGDIHGGLKGLRQVIKRVNLAPEDHLIFLGDYVDGWSESAQVIDYLMELNEEYQCDFIFGNHDAWCYDWLRDGTTNSIWLMHGGRETIRSYQNHTSSDKELHLLFFKEMENYLIDDQNRLFVHAGFSSMHGPAKEHYMTNYSWDRTLWETAMAAHGRIERDENAYPERLKLFKEIFIGHTPTTKWGIMHPWNRANIWNVDTGAAFKGMLSVMDVDTREIWQSEPLTELYPNEKGRNK